jgi:plasmid stabilization system protein ParE
VASIHWSLDAEEDLARIITGMRQSSPPAAHNFLVQLFSTLDRLEQFPASGRVLREMGNPNLREVIFRNYRVFYLALDDEVFILHILHGSMDIARELRRRPWNLPEKP